MSANDPRAPRLVALPVLVVNHRPMDPIDHPHAVQVARDIEHGLALEEAAGDIRDQSRGPPGSWGIAPLDLCLEPTSRGRRAVDPFERSFRLDPSGISVVTARKATRGVSV